MRGEYVRLPTEVYTKVHCARPELLPKEYFLKLGIKSNPFLANSHGGRPPGDREKWKYAHRKENKNEQR